MKCKKDTTYSVCKVILIYFILAVIFLSFHKPKSLLTTFFIPDKKWVVSLWRLLSQNFAATGVVVLSFQFSTIKFSLPATKIHHQTRGKLQRDKKIKYMIKNSLIGILILLTSCPIGKKRPGTPSFLLFKH